MRPTGRTEQIQFSIGIYFAPKPPRLAPAMLRLGKQYIDIPPGEKKYVVTDSYVLPVDVEVHAVQPHAHYRAREIRGFATLPDGTKQWLIYIPNWDFDWQDTYRYVKPITLKKGTTLTMEYTYDNSESNRRNPQIPPQRVHWGQNSSDEMGDLWIQVVTRSPADLDRLVREFKQKVFSEDILGYESVLRQTPNDVALHDDVALLYMAVGRNDQAIAHFSESVRLSPAVAATHFNLATVLAAAGHVNEATSEYRRALELKPDYAFAHNNLGSVLFATGNLDEAVAHVRRALEIMPSYADAEYNLARMLVVEEGTEAAVLHYRRALELRSDWLPVLGETSWLLATDPTARLKDPAAAVRYAERAVVLSKGSDPVFLDILAAAYAAAGRFEQAINSVKKASELATDDVARAALRERLARYEDHRPFVDIRRDGPIRPR
jgi:tetratricopeptide (TPR) repeat protein